MSQHRDPRVLSLKLRLLPGSSLAPPPCPGSLPLPWLLSSSGGGGGGGVRLDAAAAAVAAAVAAAAAAVSARPAE